MYRHDFPNSSMVKVWQSNFFLEVLRCVKIIRMKTNRFRILVELLMSLLYINDFREVVDPLLNAIDEVC